MFIYFLIDASYPADGDIIGIENECIRSFIKELIDIKDDYPHEELYIRAMRFASEPAWITEYMLLDEIEWENVEACGTANLGAAYELLSSELKK